MSSTNPTFALRKKLPANPLGNVLFSLGMVAKVINDSRLLTPQVEATT